jgi:membrane protein implicated in regulation of membrane protease activity
MDSPEEWRWIWLVAAFVFAVAEMANPGSFFLLPFAIGALVATVLAFADIGLGAEWIAFVAVSAATLVALRPIARRLDLSGEDAGVGARRLVGQTATVLAEIPGERELGLVRIHREEWRAESLDGSVIPQGATVKVAEVEGTRVLVAPVDQLGQATPPPVNPSEGADT